MHTVVVTQKFPAATPAGRPRPRSANPLVSLVVPVLNEAENIALFIGSVQRVFEPADICFEIVFIDDGSDDATWSIISQAATSTAKLRGLKLSRNFGKEAAMTAGIDAAEGDVVVPIDVDLQDPPELVLEMLEAWRQGFDVVYAARAARRSDTLFKRGAAGGFYRVFNQLSPLQIPADVGDFRLMDRRVIEALKRLPERNRFMKGLYAWVGFPTTAVYFERQPRSAGQTKFNLSRLWNFALDGIVSFSTIPLKICTWLGLFTALLAIGYSLWIVGKTILLGVDVPGYASLMSVILFGFALQFISLGILGEYIGRLFLEAKQRPLYLVEADTRETP